MKKTLLLLLAFGLVACEENEIAQSLLEDHSNSKFELVTEIENCDDSSEIADYLNRPGRELHSDMPFIRVLPTETQSTTDMEVELTSENKFLVKFFELSLVGNQIEKTLVEQAVGTIEENAVFFDDLCAEPLVFQIKIDK